METAIRSWVKSAIWRVMGVIILALVTYAYTRNWITTSWVTILHHGVFLVVFVIHERFWLHIDFTGLKRKIFKAITYETILGNFILAIITLIITGDVQSMTKITLTYIGIIYVLNEFVWDKVSLGRG
jgi:uncharacterized membrane protein